MTRETWYVLENGTVANPREVALDPSGVLRHSSGVAVEMRGEVPRSRGVDPDEERAKTKKTAKAMNAAEKVLDTASAHQRTTKPAAKAAEAEQPTKHYRTRETRGR